MTGSDSPGPWYFDASALARLYVAGPFSQQLNTAFAGRTDLFVSDLSITEVTSAICRLRREGVLTSEGTRHIHRRLLHDVAEGVFECLELTSEMHRATEKRLLAVDRVELRAGDALHLGLALAARCRGMITFDRRLADASASNGLFVYPE